MPLIFLDSACRLVQRLAASVLASAFLMLLAGGNAAAAEVDPDYPPRLQQILREGIQHKSDLEEIERAVQAVAGSFSPAPGLSYAHGLILQSRLKHDLAAENFAAAVQSDPGDAAAWQSLVRLHLLEKSADALCDDLVTLAETLAKGDVAWDPEEKAALAGWLGRVHGFLTLPDVEVVPAAELSHNRWIVSRRLPEELHEAYEAGRQAIQLDYETRLAEIQLGVAAGKQEAATKLKELGEREQELDKQAETVQLTRQQWSSWLEEQLKQSEQQLETLRDDYTALDKAARKLSALSLQAELDRQRLRTEYSLRGISAADIARQPALIRLEQEVLRYRRERQSLQQQGLRVMATARQVVAARVAATNRYQQATGELKKADATLNRWLKTVSNSSLKAKEKTKTAGGGTDRKLKRLTRSATWFESDPEAEADRLLKAFGLSLSDGP